MVAARKRRSPEEAKAVLLTVAESRLAEYGLGGLNIVDVAKQAGMSHATLIHHFGSTAGMRRALVNRMTDRLLHDIIDSLDRDQPDAVAILESLFEALTRGGHAKLLAWLSIGDGVTRDLAEPSPHVMALFQTLIPSLSRHLPAHARSDVAARRMVYLVASSAIGYGIGGEVLARVIGFDAEESRRFPAWLGEQIEHLMADLG